MPQLPKNLFYDINHLPSEEGMLVFGISMNRISNAQSPERYFEFLQHIDTKIKKTNGIGAIFLYGDYLYFLSNDPAKELRARFLSLMFQHKNGFLNIVRKHVEWIPKSFSFTTYGQLLLDNADIFADAYRKVSEVYRKDKKFQQYVLDDCMLSGKGNGREQQTFFLEEITMFYLISKGKFILKNEFIGGHEQWTLNCYPGKPLKSEAYLYQLNPLCLENRNNKYEHCYYDLAARKLYDFQRIDIDTFDFVD